MANLKHYIDPGELDSRVTVQVASGASDGYGDEAQAWYDLATLWAKVEWPETGGTEGEDAKQVLQTQRVHFTIRYYSALTPKMRISCSGKIYDIEGIAEVGGRNRFMKVVTKLHDSNPV